jgi:hypothetical protein
MMGAARRARISTTLRKVRDWARAQRELRVYRINRARAARFGCDTRVEVNALTDFLRFESYQDRDVFLANALARLERGETAYTISIDERLAHCSWMMRDQAQLHLPEVSQSVRLPPGSVTLRDDYTHPDFRGRGLCRVTMGHMLHDAFADDRTQHAYVCVLADRLPSRHTVEALGFEYQGSLYWRCRFGTESTWADSTFGESAPVTRECRPG